MGDPSGPELDAIQEIYARERDKRLNVRPEANAQYVPVHTLREDEKLSRFAADPWEAELLELQRTRGVRANLEDGSHTRILIVGAGFGGLLFAVRLLQAGFSVDDLLIVDSAGGFGGTWYWNRYPGDNLQRPACLVPS
jgi:NADPH-dependent 2,4-dienoyl-CoA reductase/sulfur reductase-like enzyme